MIAEEHIIAWIESSQPHYKKLLQISVPGNFLSDLGRAHACMNLARTDHEAANRTFGRDAIDAARYCTRKGQI